MVDYGYLTTWTIRGLISVVIVAIVYSLFPIQPLIRIEGGITIFGSSDVSDKKSGPIGPTQGPSKPADWLPQSDRALNPSPDSVRLDSAQRPATPSARMPKAAPGATAGLRDGEVLVQVDYSVPVPDLARTAGIRLVVPKGLMSIDPTKYEGKRDRVMRVVSIDSSVVPRETSGAIYELELKDEGYRPATLTELMAFVTAHPDLIKVRGVMATGWIPSRPTWGKGAAYAKYNPHAHESSISIGPPAWEPEYVRILGVRDP